MSPAAAGVYFSSGGVYTLGATRPGDVVVEDLNGDNKPDVAIVSATDHKLTILLGDGSGGFSSSATYAVGQSSSAYEALTSADFNGDQKPDIAVASSSPASDVEVFLGKGEGTFEAPVAYAAGTSPSAIDWGDFTGDGKVDLAIDDAGDTGSAASIVILRGAGDGTFAAGTTVALGGTAPYNFGDRSPAEEFVVGDYDGDGKDDLAAGILRNTQGPAVAVFTGKGDGTFNSGVDYGLGSNVKLVLADDFNLDGADDLVAATYGEYLAEYLSDGSPLSLTGELPTGDSPHSVDSGDLNNDGYEDVVVADSGIRLGAGDVAGYFGASDGSLTFGGDLPFVGYPWIVRVGDLNGDGWLDLVVVDLTTDGAHSVLVTGLNAPAVTFAAASIAFAQQTVGSTSQAQSVTVVNDGGPPLVIRSVAVSGSNASDFTVTDPGSCTVGAHLAGGASCTLKVGFTPSAGGARSASLAVTPEAPGLEGDLPLTGTGVALPPPPSTPAAPLPPTSTQQVLGTRIAPACVVPKLKGVTLRKAEHAVRNAGCRVGKVTRTKAAHAQRGRVVATRPPARAKRRAGFKVALIIGR